MDLRLVLSASLATIAAAGTVVAAEPQAAAPVIGRNGIATVAPQPDPERGARAEYRSGATLSHRSLSSIGLDVRAALRAEAAARQRGGDAAAVIRLVDLFRELATHPRRGESAFAAQLGWKLRSRLRDAREHIERQTSKSPRQAAMKQRPPELSAPESWVLAQQIAVPGGVAGGPGARAVAGRPGAGRAADYGPELVELIEQTISPATWNINGGNGSVVYFAPLRVLVVSAPASVHGQVGNVLGQLRAAP